MVVKFTLIRPVIGGSWRDEFWGNWMNWYQKTCCLLKVQNEEISVLLRPWFWHWQRRSSRRIHSSTKHSSLVTEALERGTWNQLRRRLPDC